MGDLRRYAFANARLRALRATLLHTRGLDALYSYPDAGAMRDALARTAYGHEPRRRLPVVAMSLVAALSGPERRLIETYARRLEVESLQGVIRAIAGGVSWDAVEPLLLDLGPLAGVDMAAVRPARDLRDLVDRLAPTVYGAALGAALPNVERVGPFALEKAIELDYHERLWATAAELRAGDRAIAQRLLGTLADVLNLSWIAHYRDALGLSAEETLNYTLRHGHWITAEIRRALAEEPRSWRPLARTPFAELDEAGTETSLLPAWRVLASEARRALCGYPFHIGGPLGLLVSVDLETRDIAALQAAKRFAMTSGDAFAHLTTVREA